MPFLPHDAPPSGVSGLIGFQSDLNAPDGSTRITLALEAHHLNVSGVLHGVLHGGLHTLLLDVAAGFACARHLAQNGPFIPVLTLSLSTDYIAGVSAGTVTARGRVSGGGYKIVFAEALLYDAEDRILSRANGVFKRGSK